MPTQIAIKNFKSYGEEGINLQEIRPITLIIGRNNSGKSAILDAMEAIYSASMPVAPTNHHLGKPSKFTYFGTISEISAKRHFPENTSGGWIPNNHWVTVGQHLSGTDIEVDFSNKQRSCNSYTASPSITNVRSASPTVPLIEHPQFKSKLNELAGEVPTPFTEKRVIRLGAERDIVPEIEHTNKLTIAKNGAGVTNTITQVILSTKYNSALVERDLLNTINRILAPDMHISGIRPRKHGDGTWEIFLEEKDKGAISLTDSGSGLKTIIMTAVLFELIPSLDQFDASDAVYLLEELENNLHPALQRRLLEYVKYKIGKAGTAFITTHSSAVIDMFNHDPEAQIFHVQHRNGTSTAHLANTYVHHRGVLDDLDVRASDILQSNGIVWVEGPSDRIYVNRWINLLSSGELREGRHYQCVFYGGRLLAHLSAENLDKEELSEAVGIFRANRNAIIVIDSDKSTQKDSINATKTRIAEEFREMRSVCWITDGREIENYTPRTVLEKIDSRLSSGIGRFEEVEKFLNAKIGNDGWKRIFKSKMLFAEMVTELTDLTDIEQDSELCDRVRAVVDEILKWNGE
jgi:hypothetical protein